jgi:hypothetical protein
LGWLREKPQKYSPWSTPVLLMTVLSNSLLLVRSSSKEGKEEKKKEKEKEKDGKSRADEL